MSRKGQKMNMVKFETDVAFEDESFEEVLERLGAALPEVFIRVVRLVGSGGGWPTIEVILPETQIAEFAKWYCEDDAEMWAEAIAAEAVKV
jgi:hypothetical protein